MEISGKIYQVGNIETVTGKSGDWQKQTIVIETENGKYTKKVAILVTKDLTKWDFQVGKEVSFEYDIESREYNGRWFTDAKAWRVNSLTNGDSNG